MADYRSWCNSCGEEVVFGGHARGCSGVAAAEAALRERRRANDAFMKTLRELPYETLAAEYEGGLQTISDLEDALFDLKKATELRKAVMIERGSYRDISEIVKRVENRYKS